MIFFYQNTREIGTVLLDPEACQHSVHPTGGSRRVFRQVAWLEVGSVKAVLPRPAHPRVTPAVRR